MAEKINYFGDGPFSGEYSDLAQSVKRIADARVIKGPQFREDAGQLSHPVRPQSFVEINNFLFLLPAIFLELSIVSVVINFLIFEFSIFFTASPLRTA